MTSPRSNIAGLFKFSWEDCQDETELSRDEIETSLKIADARDFAIYDSQTRWVWVINRVWYEFPKGEISDKQREGIRRVLDDAPKCLLVLAFCEYYKGLGNPFESHYLSLSQCPSVSLSKGTDPTLYSRLSTLYSLLSVPPSEVLRPQNDSPKDGSWGTPEEFVVLYNASVPAECPRVKILTPGRRKKICTYLAMFKDRKFWEETFTEFHHSRLLRGLINNSGHQSFVGDLDWLLSRGKDGTENAVKVHDGKYRDRIAASNRGPRYQPRQTG